MECGYKRATEEQLEEETNQAGETIYLEEKIQYWRDNIPCAEGLPELRNPMYLQRQMQMVWRAHEIGRAPDSKVLMGDLLGWRHADLQHWSRCYPGGSPTTALPLVSLPA